MPYKVAIRKNETGEVRMYEIDFTDWDRGEGRDDLFWWTEGNLSCDCNRGLCWENAGASVEALEMPSSEENEIPCGDEKFSALYADLPDGRRILIDEEK